jgi:threonine dehydrogenase-like Zn-dependent dehydrogenase
MAEDVLAAVKLGASQIETRAFSVPAVAEDSALLRVEAAGMCGAYAGFKRENRKGPVILGHENVGYIAEAGRMFQERHGVREGDLVALEEYLPCHHCEWCRIGEYRLCWLVDLFNNPNGVHYGNVPVAVEPSLWGGYSQYMYLPANVVLHKLPPETDVNAAAYALPLANGVQWAVVEGEAGPGKTIVIQGPGPKGLGCVLAAKIHGADNIIVTGLTSDAPRLEAAKRLGADYTIDVQTQDFKATIMDLTHGRGVDAVVDCTSSDKEEVVLQTFDVLKRKGGIVVTQGYELTRFPLQTLSAKYVTLRMCRGHSYSSVATAVDWIISGKYPLAELMTHHYGINEVDVACLVSGGEGAGSEAVSVVVHPWQ